MQYATRRHADAWVMRPAGRIDHTQAAAFEQAVLPLAQEAGNARGALVLDFEAVEYISSVGLRVLMILAKQLRERNAKFVLAAPSTVVSEILTISRFDKVLSIAATMDAAMAMCSPAASESWAASRAAP